MYLTLSQLPLKGFRCPRLRVMSPKRYSYIVERSVFVADDVYNVVGC